MKSWASPAATPTRISSGSRTRTASAGRSTTSISMSIPRGSTFLVGPSPYFLCRRAVRRLRAAPLYRLEAAILGEVLGTFVLVLFGTGAVATAVLTGALQGLWQVAAVWAIGVM